MKTEDVKLAIDYYEKQLNSAQVVLDSGFGEKENESNRIYLKRKEMSNFALVALKEKLERLDNKPLTLDELKNVSNWIWLKYTNYCGDECQTPVFIDEIYRNGRIELLCTGLNYAEHDIDGNFFCNNKPCYFYKYEPVEVEE